MERFTNEHFNYLKNLIYNRYGIVYQDHKKEMLHSKLLKLKKIYNIDKCEDLIQMVESSREEKFLHTFQDLITVHKTNFFRENAHFDFISKYLPTWMKEHPQIFREGEIRAWSSACSTGEEVYTLAITMMESIPQNFKIRVLGTDVSARVVDDATKGLYSHEIRNDIESTKLQKYFQPSNNGYEVSHLLKSVTSFRQFNLMDSFPFQKKFAIIFCRNVMIYFDHDVQRKLMEKFYNSLHQGGLLFIGHSESMVNKEVKFKYMQPAVYMKY